MENQEFYTKVLDLGKTGTQKQNPEDRFSYNGAQILAAGQGKAVNIIYIIGASVTPKLSANAPLLCAQVYDRRKRFFCKMSANVIAPIKD